MRTTLFACGALATLTLVGTVLAPGCDGGGAYTGTTSSTTHTTTGSGAAGGAAGAGQGGAGNGGAGGHGVGVKGVGEACTGDGECRPGLLCVNDVCEPGHTLPEGSDCILGAECQAGLYCAGGVCTTAGSGTAGDACTSDADCAAGFRCGIVGLAAQCVAEGTNDVGGACVTGADCYGGLACIGGACAPAPPGTPPWGLPWAGVDCPAENGPVEAYFRVPRGVDDGDFFRLPFPNDVRLDAGVPDLSGFPTPGPGVLGFDVVDRYARAFEQGNDGWGLYAPILFRFSGAIDFPSINGNIALVDLTTGQGLGFYYTYHGGRNKYVCSHWVAMRRAQGRTFTPGHTYAAYLLTGVQVAGGGNVARPADLVALLGASAPADPALAPEWPKYAPLRGYLSASFIDPNTVLDATVFTAGHPRLPLEGLQATLNAAPAPAVSAFTRCDSGVASPCPDATGERACQAADPDFDELHALVTLPVYQQGTAPYLDPADGGGFALDVNGAPVMVRTEDVCLSLTVPKGAPPLGGWPTVVFAHGTGGHFRDHVVDGLAGELALGVDDGTGNVVRAAVLGIDQVAHGPRRGGSTLAPDDLFFNFGNPAAARGNTAQGAADQMALLRLVPSIAVPAGVTGTAFTLGTSVALWGHSQGATEGAIALPYGAWAGAVLTGAGASLRDALLTKTSPQNVAAIAPWVLGDAAADGTLSGGVDHPALALVQMFMDGSDPVAYGALAAIAPPPGVAAHHLLQIYGLADSYAPSVVQATYALAAQLGLVVHDASVATPEPIGSLAELPVPASGNLVVGGKTVSAYVREYAPTAPADGHFVAFDVPQARADAERFLARALAGGVPRVGP